MPPLDAKRARRSNFWVTHKPWSAMDDIGFAPGRKPAAGATLWIEVGGRRSPMRMHGAYACPRDTAALAASTRAAATERGAEVVTGWSEAVNGEEAPTHTCRWALSGLSESYAAISEACTEAPSAGETHSAQAAR